MFRAIVPEAGGNAESLKGLDPEDDVADPYIQEGESDGPETPGTVETEGSSEAAPDSLEISDGFPEHYSVDDVGPRNLAAELTSAVSDNEVLPSQPCVPREQMQALLDASVAKLSELLLFRNIEVVQIIPKRIFIA